jgi:hypothetical protein
MNRTKALFLFLALLLPVCIFIFLKIFGKNEFNVEPLFSNSPPPASNECQTVSVPYYLDDSIKSLLPFGSDSLVVIAFGGNGESNAVNQLTRLKGEIANLPIGFLTLPKSNRHLFWKRCLFFLQEPQDVVTVDAKGRIRGQYISADREDIDRLLTELTIILKRY